MHLICKVDRHHASSCEIWNDGHFFSFCRHCGCDLIRRSNSPWRPVRPPARVVWKARGRFDLPWTPDELPMVPAEHLPVAPEWRQMIARNRQLAGRSPSSEGDDADAAAEPIASDTIVSAATPIAAPAAMSVG